MLSFFTADPLSTEKQSFPFKINPYSLLLLHFLTNNGRRFPVLGSIISHLARLPQSSDDPLFHGQRKRRNHFRLEHHLLCCIFCQQLTLFTLKGLSNTHTATSTTETAFLTIRVWLHYFLFDFSPLTFYRNWNVTEQISLYISSTFAWNKFILRKPHETKIRFHNLFPLKSLHSFRFAYFCFNVTPSGYSHFYPGFLNRIPVRLAFRGGGTSLTAHTHKQTLNSTQIHSQILGLHTSPPLSSSFASCVVLFGLF